ncbi:MAG: patatin-like phospholipase family protein [Smithella sp.]
MKRKFDHQILLLQGGGALGAYQAGVYEGLMEAGVAPTWVVGISIGAINAALIAGNPPEQRVKQLRAFWNRVSSYDPITYPFASDAMRSILNQISAGYVMGFGVPGFFKPRIPMACFVSNKTPGEVSIYDTSPLRTTIEELVDFDLINSREVRLSLGTAHVRTGNSVYFDNRYTHLGPDHVLASGALPPGFPPVNIDGEYYWDGGVVSNTPMTYVVDQKPLTSALIIQVDIFNARGELPRNLDQVQERAKDIQYASRTRLNVNQVKTIGELQAAAGRLIKKLPPGLKSDPDIQFLAPFCRERDWVIGMLLHRRRPPSSSTKDYEFSRATVNELWAAGLEDIRHANDTLDSIQPVTIAPGIRVYDLTQANTPSDVEVHHK